MYLRICMKTKFRQLHFRGRSTLHILLAIQGDTQWFELIELAEEVKYIVLPYESDAQIAHLLSSREADFPLTEVSDLSVFGCKKVRDASQMQTLGDLV